MPTTPNWRRSGRAFPAALRPITASRLPRSSPATSTTFIASIRIAVQPGRDSLGQSGQRPDVSIRPHLAAGAARIVRRLNADARSASRRRTKRIRTGSPPHADRPALFADKLVSGTICVARRPADTRSCRCRFAIWHSHVGADGLTITAGEFDLSRADAVLVRTMPPGSLEQVVLRMDLLARLEAAGTPVINPPRAIEAAVDKYLTTAKLAAAGLPVPQDERLPVGRGRPGGVRRLGWRRRRSSRCSAAKGGESLDWPIGPSPSEPSALLVGLGAVLYLQEFIRHPGYDVRVLARRPEGLRHAAGQSARLADQHQPRCHGRTAGVDRPSWSNWPARAAAAVGVLRWPASICSRRPTAGGG